jgi:hypothetical protein
MLRKGERDSSKRLTTNYSINTLEQKKASTKSTLGQARGIDIGNE